MLLPSHKEFLSFYPAGTSASGKTQIVTVATRVGILIGQIKWMPRWRQYAFFVHKNAWLSPGCMTDISDIISRLAKEQRAKKESS